MPPKRVAEDEEVHKLQAIVFADSFKKRFSPIAYERPKALCPLVNVPLLDYVMDCLARSKVEVVFIFIRSNVEKFEQYLASRKWKNRMTVHAVVATQAKSFGDAFREIDGRNLIRGDFILIHSDVVCNMNLSLLVEEHKKRREKDKNAIMTCLMKVVPTQHRCRTAEDDITVVLDSTTNQILQYEITGEDEKSGSTFSVSTASFEEHESVSVRYDLMDCHIAVCSPEVIMAFSDNFDWQDIQNDFIKGILTSDILGQKLFVKTITREYAAQVKCLTSYDAISKDIIRRWTYPLVPDVSINGDSAYEYCRPGLYKDHNVYLAQSCTVSEECVIGSGTSVGDRSNIKRSVIGRNCVIGANVELHGCYVWDNVTILDGAKLDRVVLCDGVSIGQNATVERGSVLSFGVKIAACHRVEPYTRLTCTAEEAEGEDEDWGDDEDEQSTTASATFVTDPKSVGPSGVGRKWSPGEDEDGTNCNSIVYEPAENQDDAESEGSDSASESDDDEDGDDTFAREVRDTVRRGVTENHVVDNIVLEINSLKLSHDKSFGECGAAVLPALLSTLPPSTNQKEMALAIKKVLSKWKTLLSKYIKPTVTYDQIAVVSALEIFCWGLDHFKPLFHAILKMLYDVEILVEDGILEWAEEATDRGDDLAKFFVAQSSKLIDWLKESDSDSD